MRRRNWEYLSRKLVDTTDLDFSFNAVQAYMAANNLAFFGSGVLITTTYPGPFSVSLNGFNGTVGRGIAYDPTGLQTRIDDNSGAPFTVPIADATQDRLDLLVLRYKAIGDTQIPEPDLPTQNTWLNIHDGFEVAVVTGTPSANPTYPSKGSLDIILAGLSVPGGALAPTVDLSIREMATPLRTFFPTFKQEKLSGTVDGTNTQFTLSTEPLDAASLVVLVDGLMLTSTEWSLSGLTVTVNDPPQPGQHVYAYYVVNAAGTVNPVSGTQEVPGGLVDGLNQTFTLSAEPVDQNSTQVYVDGLLVPITGWSLIQSPTQSAIVFNAGYIPAQGQSVYAFYLRNAVAVANAPQSTAPTTGLSVNLSTEYPQLSGTDITNGYVTLTHTPTQPTMVLMDIIGDSAQAYGLDFTVSGNQLTWVGDLTQTLSQGDRLRVHYAY